MKHQYQSLVLHSRLYIYLIYNIRKNMPVLIFQEIRRLLGSAVERYSQYLVVSSVL